jgi:hypothetical protein
VNEADTRATLIEPKLKAAGWTDRLVTREYSYQCDHQFSPGRIILIGDQVRRGTSKHKSIQTLFFTRLLLLSFQIFHFRHRPRPQPSSVPRRTPTPNFAVLIEGRKP